jgi:transcriptional regulator with XRE-family HTH domain
MLIIREDAKKKKINNKLIAGRLNVSEGQISNYFNVNNHIPFNKFIELLTFIYEDTKQIDQHIEKYINETKRIENLKEAAEWFSVNGDYKKISNLVKRHKKRDCIFEIYEVFLKRKKQYIGKEEFYRSVEEIKEHGINNIDTKVLCRIATAYANLDFNAYTTVEFLMNDTLALLDKLNNNFIQTSYKLRCYELIARACIARNNLKKAENILLYGLGLADSDTFPVPVSAYFHLLSEIYLSSDYTKAINYNTKAFEALKKVHSGVNHERLAGLKATHDFIKIHHNNFSNLYLNNPAEKAHLLAKIGGEENCANALMILEEIESKNGYLSPFQLYYKGLVLKDKKVFEQSEYEFINGGNLYYAIIPKTAKDEILG